MSKLERFRMSTLAVLMMVSLASGALVGCSSSTSSEPADDPGVNEAASEACNIECLSLGEIVGSAEYKECMEECMEQKK